MDGQLKDHPLAELIHEISAARLSGALRLACERVKGVVYFDAGRVVAALSNLRAMRLTEILRMSGAVDPARLFAAVGEGASDEEAASALVGAGVITESALKRARERQTLEVLRDLLRRQEGEWGFDPRVRLVAARHSCTDAAQLLVESARDLTPERVASRMCDDAETLAPAPDAFEKVSAGGISLSPAEGFILSRICEPTNLRYVLSVSGLPEDETRRAVYALTLGGLVERGRGPRALSANLSRHAAERAGVKAAPTPQPQAEAAQPEPEAEALTTQTTEEDPRELIEELLALARGQTHYGVLGVSRSATAADLKRAYYSLARRLHPDRLRRSADADTQQRIDAAFARVAQAYDVLKDTALRASYDLKIAKSRGAPTGGDSSRADAARADATRADAGRADFDTAAPRADESSRESRAGHASPGAQANSQKSDEAEKKFRLGLAAHARGDFVTARLLFGEAARLAPEHAAYRAHFGRTLAREKSTRRQAESELLAAVSLDALDPSIRVMLAELYKEVGLRLKAMAQLERALALEPSNAEARAMLRELSRADT